MSFSHSSYTEISTPFLSFYGAGPTLSDAQLPEHAFVHDKSAPSLLMSYPPVATYSEEPGFLTTRLLPSQYCLAGDTGTMSSATPEPQAQQETSFLDGSSVQDILPYDVAFLADPFSPGQDVAYSTPSSHKRTLRGRKSKAAFEVCPQLVNSLADLPLMFPLRTVGPE